MYNENTFLYRYNFLQFLLSIVFFILFSFPSFTDGWKGSRKLILFNYKNHYCRLPRHRLFYPRNKKFVSIRDIVIFDISTRSSRHRDSRSFPYFNNNSITNHSESIYNIFVLYFAQTFVGGCVCACVFILLSSFIIYWEPSVTYVRESLTITYHTRRVVPRKWSTRNIVVFFFFSFFFLFY